MQLIQKSIPKSKKSVYSIDMIQSAENLLERFIHRFTHYFMVKDVGRFLLENGYRIPAVEIKNYLETNSRVFPLEKDFYITRAGAFTGELFSIKPSSSEFAKGVFIPGDRCMPFVDSELYSSDIEFYYEGQKLPSRAIEVESDEAMDLFMLFGEEYAPQYIAADPANTTLDLVEKEFTLPNTVMLTGVDISSLIESGSFSKTDRFLCKVLNWERGTVEIKVVHEAVDGDIFNKGEAGERRLLWYRTLENLLLKNFDRLGPCSSIEEQLADLFFEHRKELCINDCGSVTEYLNSYARKTGIEYFGVETRIWKKGETVPAVGEWNKGQFVSGDWKQNLLSPEDKFFYAMPEFITDQFIIDMFYRRSENYDELLKRIYLKEKSPHSAHNIERNYILLHLQERSGILRVGYNWFADQTIGPVRQKALLLYARVALLVYEIDGYGKSLDKFPQQELVILSQLFNHITRILESVSNQDHIEEDAEALLMSLDGMELNFDDIKSELEAAIMKEKKRNFTIVK